MGLFRKMTKNELKKIHEINKEISEEYVRRKKNCE